MSVTVGGGGGRIIQATKKFAFLHAPKVRGGQLHDYSISYVIFKKNVWCEKKCAPPTLAPTSLPDATCLIFAHVRMIAYKKREKNVSFKEMYTWKIIKMMLTVGNYKFGVRLRSMLMKIVIDRYR